MKKIIILFLLINMTELLAGNHFGIKYGINYSKFYNDNNSSFLRGYSFGINYEYSFLENYFIGAGLYYSKVGGILKNKTVYVEEYGTLWLDDIKAQVGYLKLPLNIGFNFIIKKSLLFKIYFGYSNIFPNSDYTKTSDDSMIQEGIKPSSDVKYDYKYVGMDESVFPTGNYSHSMIDFGAGLVYKKYSLDLMSHVQLGEFGTFDNISKIKKSLFTIEVLFGLFF